ncbi:MAG: HK97 family phage prohead protease [Blastococcus sp.]
MADKALAVETRTITAPIEVRMDGDAPTLVGYAATFNQPYDLGAFREVVDPNAFNRTLGTSPDVRLLVDHEGQPLARTKSGTLRLTPDAVGLRAEATLDPSDPDVQRLLPKMRRGDLDQMSFAFRVPAGGDSWSDDYSQRTLRNVELNGGDVSVVTYPANPATSVSLRARDEREAACVLMEALVREVRVGKTLSAANIAKLQQVLDALAAADTANETVDEALDGAQAVLSDVLDVANPDPDLAEDDQQANSARPLGLAQAIAKRLSIPA